jgi:biotin operon repressor
MSTFEQHDNNEKPLNAAEREQEILKLILFKPKQWKCDSLGKNFGVTRQTISKQINQIRNKGIPSIDQKQGILLN